MKTKGLRRELTKIGAIVENIGCFNTTGNQVVTECIAKLPLGEPLLAWYEIGEKIQGLRTPYPNTDIQYSCFAKKYHNTIRSAIDYILLDI